MFRRQSRPYPATEGPLARTVLAVVAHHRAEGLQRENMALISANRRLNDQVNCLSRSLTELNDVVFDQSISIARLVADNGELGGSRPDIRGNNRVCGLCFEALTAPSNIHHCACGEYAYCSKACQEFDWHRRHGKYCSAVSPFDRIPRLQIDE